MPTTRRPTAAELIAKLDLAPNQTCGFVRVSYTSDLQLHDALPAPLDGTRPLGTALIFLVTPEAPVRHHRIRNEQLYHYYATRYRRPPWMSSLFPRCRRRRWPEAPADWSGPRRR